ncbi:hypothetical protein F5I97DRAFT_899312 [Phlebopus sp. FC_14]|nr:hypothetical protein F5I97DRAFT_899312 [Phlebopus sp. FC_14]
MARYVFPSSHPHSPYPTYQQPVVYTTSTPSYGTPIRRHNSFNGHTSPQVYGVSNAPYYSPSSHGHAGTQYLVVPGHRSRSRSRSRSSHGHGHGHTHSRSHSHTPHHQHGHSASVTSPNVVYTSPSAPIYDTGHNRSSSHRHPSHSSHHSHAHSHHSHSPRSHHSHSHSHAANYYSGHQRTTSFGDRVRQMFGFEPSHSHPHHTSSYGDSGRRRHNSFSGHRDENKLHRTYSTRTGPWFLGSTDNRRFVDEHGREVDHRGRVIHRM